MSTLTEIVCSFPPSLGPLVPPREKLSTEISAPRGPDLSRGKTLRGSARGASRPPRGGEREGGREGGREGRASGEGAAKGPLRGGMARGGLRRRAGAAPGEGPGPGAPPPPPAEPGSPREGPGGAPEGGEARPGKQRFFRLTALPNLRTENMAQLAHVPGEPEWFKRAWGRLETYCAGCMARGTKGRLECFFALALGTVVLGTLSAIAGLAVGAVAALSINHNVLGLGAIRTAIEEGVFDSIWRTIVIRM